LHTESGAEQWTTSDGSDEALRDELAGRVKLLARELD